MLYCSRVFRIFWFKDINDFTLEFCRVLLEKVIDLEKLLKTLCNLRYNGVIEKINLSKPKDMKELQTLPTGSNRTEPSHGSKLHDSLFKFTRKVTQLLKMIQSINLLPSMAFGSALAQPCETFHENMFHYILRDYHSEVIDEMRSHFPLYMTNSFYRVCKLWNDVDLEHDENKVI